MTGTYEQIKQRLIKIEITAADVDELEILLGY